MWISMAPRKSRAALGVGIAGCGAAPRPWPARCEALTRTTPDCAMSAQEPRTTMAVDSVDFITALARRIRLLRGIFEHDCDHHRRLQRVGHQAATLGDSD